MEHLKAIMGLALEISIIVLILVSAFKILQIIVKKSTWVDEDDDIDFQDPDNIGWA